MTFWPNDWAAILIPEAPIAELIVRGVLIYGLLYVGMRVAGRRLLGKFAMSDILVVLLIAVALRDGITGEYQTVGDAAISGAVILGCDMIVDRLAFHFPALRGLLRHQPLAIIRDGQLLRDNARAHLLTHHEIMGRLREEGLTSLDQVKEARLEQDGSFSIVPR